MTSKKIVRNGVVLDVVEIHRGDKYVWCKDTLGDTHIVPKSFYDSGVIYITPKGIRYAPHWPSQIHQNLIERIEYALHSGYDANDRKLLREALAALKEKA